MGIGNLISNNVIKMEDGEERLGLSYKVKVNPGVEKVLVGVDGGSTQSRVTVMDSTDDTEALQEIYTIPSIHSQLEDSIEISPKSDSLYNNLDSWIINKNPGNTLFSKLRIIRGTKYIDANVGAARVNSTVQKIDTPAFYINIVDSIGYAMLMKYGENLKSKYECYLGVSLPPDNINSVPNRNKFLERLVGDYEWTSTELGVTITISIKGVETQTEPESEVKAHYALTGSEVPEYVVLFEGGGSTIGTEILINGQSLKSAAGTLAYGGTQLQINLGNIYRENVGGRTLGLGQLKKALETGVLKQGRNTNSVVKYIVQAKDEFSQKLFNDFTTEVVDNIRDFDLNLVDTFIFAGRLFREGEFEKVENPQSEDDKLLGYSIMTPLVKKLSQSAPNADYTRLEENLIPVGNLLEAYRQFGGYVFNSDEDEEVSTDVELSSNELE